MSLLVSELSQIVVRIHAIASDRKALGHLFEELTLELGADLEPSSQKSRLTSCAIDKGLLRAWASFTLGRRAGLDLRVSLMGYSLETGLPSMSTLEMCEGFFFSFPNAGDAVNEALFKAQLSPEAKSLPIVAFGLIHDEVQSPALTQRALEEWIFRNFEKRLMLSSPQNFLKEGLEWILGC